MGQDILGRNIKRLRLQKDMTQQRLGEIVGVSSQAVSNWECGGVPNAELLPSIAFALDTTVDVLFGREGCKKAEVSEEIIKDISKTNPKNKFERAFEIACMLQASNYDPQMSIDSLHLLDFEFPYSTEEDYNYVCSRTIFGIAYLFLQKKSHYMFFAPKSERGYAKAIAPLEQYVEFFKMLSNEEFFKALVYLYSRSNVWFTRAVLQKAVHCTEEKAQEIIDDFIRREWLIQSDLQTNVNIEITYKLVVNNAILPFLCATKDVMCKMADFKLYINIDNRMVNQKTLFDAADMVDYLKGG